jgi:hypothetical protein
MTEPPSVIIQEYKSTLTPFTFPIFPAIFPEVVFELSSIWFPLHRLRYIGSMWTLEKQGSEALIKTN